MPYVLYPVIAILGAAVGAGITWLLCQIQSQKKVNVDAERLAQAEENAVHIPRLESVVEQKEAEIQRCQKELTSMDSKISEISARLAERDKELFDKTAHLAEKTVELSGVKANLAGTQARLEEQRLDTESKLAVARAELDEQKILAREQLENLNNAKTEMFAKLNAMFAEALGEEIAEEIIEETIEEAVVEAIEEGIEAETGETVEETDRDNPVMEVADKTDEEAVKPENQEAAPESTETPEIAALRVDDDEDEEEMEDPLADVDLDELTLAEDVEAIVPGKHDLTPPPLPIKEIAPVELGQAFEEDKKKADLMSTDTEDGEDQLRLKDIF